MECTLANGTDSATNNNSTPPCDGENATESAVTGGNPAERRTDSPPISGGDQRAYEHMLIERARAGDSAAFDELMRLYERKILAYATRLSDGPETAQDIAQDAWLSVFRNLHALRESSAFKSWLYRITTRLADLSQSKMSRHKTEPLQHPDGSERSELASYVNSLTDIVQKRELEEQVHKAIAQIPDPFRTAVILVDIQGLTYEAAAEELGIPIGTLRSRLSRGRELLRKKLTGYVLGEER